jgi:serine protease AprX
MPPPTLPPARPVQNRLEVDDRFSGRGVTIAFLDSGFYAHPDLTVTRHRIKAHHDVLTGVTLAHAVPRPDVSSWHGMMTSVVCAGDGSLSGGKYRGLAHDADLVLVKVGSAARIRHEDIQKGLEWVRAHREQYGIRVVNVSCGGDWEASYLHDPLSQAAEACVRDGLVVVTAVGNAGHQPGHKVYPPASAPSAIAVGGLDDAKDLEPGRKGLYHSSYGPTIDGLQKPEIIAPAIWLAAPILPGTPTAEQAKLITDLVRAEDDAGMRDILRANAGIDPDLDALVDAPGATLRNLVHLKRRDQKVINEHYKHVDGTSFAAPIITSVVAQMLEASPRLTPQEVKRLLIDTATRLDDVPIDKQGWGIVHPAAALARALERKRH